MIPKSSLVSVALGVAAFLAAWGLSVQGQEPPRQDVLGALLVEVRGLRTAIEQMSSASARVQLVMGRLQIQEQRVNGFLDRLNRLRESVAGSERELAAHRAALTEVQSAMERSIEPGERTALEQRATQLRGAVSSVSREAQRLRTEEAELAGLVSAEQGRWSDINQQLEELDRILQSR